MLPYCAIDCYQRMTAVRYCEIRHLLVWLGQNLGVHRVNPIPFDIDLLIYTNDCQSTTGRVSIGVVACHTCVIHSEIAVTVSKPFAPA